MYGFRRRPCVLGSETRFEERLHYASCVHVQVSPKLLARSSDCRRRSRLKLMNMDKEFGVEAACGSKRHLADGSDVDMNDGESRSGSWGWEILSIPTCNAKGEPRVRTGKLTGLLVE